jgi:pyruvate/2-oxoacid:ferredoxin oxidoreductase alpha subunit
VMSDGHFPAPNKLDRKISNFVAGLGGRDIRMDDIEAMVERVEKEHVEFDFLGLNRDLILERDL